MTLLFDGKRLLFEERSGCLCRALSLHLPFDGVLQLNGSQRFASKGKVIRIPLRHFKEGCNTLLLRVDRRAYPVEGLCRTGETLCPTGFPCEDTAVALLGRLEALEALVAELTARLEEQELPTMLFS